MNIKAAFAFLAVACVSCTGIYAAPPEKPPDGGGPGGGGDPGGGSSGVFTYDSFFSVTTNASCLIREGTLYGYTSALAYTVRPTSSAVTALADGVFAGNTTITTVDLSACSALLEIPPDCFAGCTALASVVLPTSCASIGANAFAGCSSLASLTAPGVTSIGADAFRGCVALASVPASAASIGDYAFAQSGVASAIVGDLHSVGEGAFSGCESLTVVDWGRSNLPNAVFAGCTALDKGDWSVVSSFGRASLAGIPATTITLSPSASLASFALAAEVATLVTTLSNDSLPTFDGTAFLGREVSYTPVAGSAARIEAADLVDWLIADAASPSPRVIQPGDYSTATLKAWLATGSNAFAYAYADDIAADSGFLALTVIGDRFIFTPPSDDAISLSVKLVGCYELSSDAGDWSEDNLVWSDADGAYVSADGNAASCFVRIRFETAW